MKHPAPTASLVTAPRPRPAAFTLTELIVVIIIIILLTAVSVPAVRSTIASTDASNAETQLRLALLSGRDAALHADRGLDTAVVFTYEAGGRTTALVCEMVGSFRDGSDDPSNPISRDIFVPVPAFPPVQLPPSWMVRGFAPAGTLLLGGASSTNNWYEGNRYDPDDRNWLFPETEFYDALATDDGQNRQSFMVRFTGGTGAVALGETREALVLSPRPTAAGRSEPPYSQARVDIGADLAGVVRKALLRDDWQDEDEVTTLFGNDSGDTILCRTVEQLALYRVSDMAAAIGRNVNRDTGCYYKPAKTPQFSENSTVMGRAVRWLEGDTNLDDNWADEDDLPVARIYTLQRYTGVLQPVPLRDLSQFQRPGGSP